MATGFCGDGYGGASDKKSENRIPSNIITLMVPEFNESVGSLNADGRKSKGVESSRGGQWDRGRLSASPWARTVSLHLHKVRPTNRRTLPSCRVERRSG